MTIKINKTANINAIGHHTNGNCKPTVRLAPFAIYASATDAAERNNVTAGAISLVCNKKSKYCKGKRYCYLEDLMEHLDEINDELNAQYTKAEAYDAIVARQRAEKEAREKYSKHQQKCAELRAKLEKEMQLMHEAEQLCESFN